MAPKNGAPRAPRGTGASRQPSVVCQKPAASARTVAIAKSLVAAAKEGTSQAASAPASKRMRGRPAMAPTALLPSVAKLLQKKRDQCDQPTVPTGPAGQASSSSENSRASGLSEEKIEAGNAMAKSTDTAAQHANVSTEAEQSQIDSGLAEHAAAELERHSSRRSLQFPTSWTSPEPERLDPKHPGTDSQSTIPADITKDDTDDNRLSERSDDDDKATEAHRSSEPNQFPTCGPLSAPTLLFSQFGPEQDGPPDAPPDAPDADEFSSPCSPLVESEELLHCCGGPSNVTANIVANCEPCESEEAQAEETNTEEDKKPDVLTEQEDLAKSESKANIVEGGNENTSAHARKRWSGKADTDTAKRSRQRRKPKDESKEGEGRQGNTSRRATNRKGQGNTENPNCDHALNRLIQASPYFSSTFASWCFCQTN